MKRILLDVDGVLADFARAAVNYARARGIDASCAQLSQWDLFEAMGCPNLQADFDQYVNESRLGLNLVPYVGARAFYKALCGLGEVAIVTSPYKESHTWCYDRRVWLRKWFATEPDIIFASAKYMVRGDVLIDDGPHNINEFPGPAIIIDRPWNQPGTINTVDGPGADYARVRCDNYADAVEACDFLLKAPLHAHFAPRHLQHGNRDKNELG